ncbi:hypothetical protein [Pseudomonas sp. GD03944]|uniref:hypothetical protein n=1 Tax=Pseudomonas sp. GD03944 TaxID=2975409 RepID=UPI002447F20A|nr:hypothetical protein [Pseudomonas sp. GD03944]MDH1265876.1 hypothetical protein [Pseudomonas sp. GD03944]
MGLVNRACFEAPLYLQNDSLHVDVLWHGQQVVAVNILFNGAIQAVYYPPQPTSAEADELERLCRLALGRYQMDGKDRAGADKRPAIVLDSDIPKYEGVLLSLPNGTQFLLEDERQPA